MDGSHMGVEPMKIGGRAWWETGGAMGAGPTGGMATAQPIGRGGGAGGGAWRGLTWGAESRRGEEAERRTAKSGGGVGGGSAPKLPVRHSPVLGPCGRGRAAVGGRRLPRYPKMGQRPPASPPHWVGLNPEPHQRWGRAVPPMLYGGAKGLDGGTNLGGGGFLPLRGGRQGPRWGGSAGPSPWEDLNGTGGVKCCCSPPPLRSPPVEGSQPHPCGEGSPPHRRCPRLRGGAAPPAPGAPWTDPALTSSHGCSCGTLSSWGGGGNITGGS